MIIRTLILLSLASTGVGASGCASFEAVAFGNNPRRDVQTQQPQYVPEASSPRMNTYRPPATTLSAGQPVKPRDPREDAKLKEELAVERMNPTEYAAWDAKKKEQAAVEAREKERKIATESGLCKVDTAVDECDKRIYLGKLVDHACSMAAAQKASEADAKQEIAESKKFGVVNLTVLQDEKENARLFHDNYEAAKQEIKEVRGKPFSPKECR